MWSIFVILLIVSIIQFGYHTSLICDGKYPRTVVITAGDDLFSVLLSLFFIWLCAKAVF